MPGWRDEGSHNSRKRVPEKRLKRDASQDLVRNVFVPILYQMPAFSSFNEADNELDIVLRVTRYTLHNIGL